MLASLRVGEVGAIVLVYGKTKSTFEASDVVFEEVRIFFEVDGFQGELAESFAAVCVRGGLGCDTSAAEFGACAVLLLLLDSCCIVYLSV